MDDGFGREAEWFFHDLKRSNDESYIAELKAKNKELREENKKFKEQIKSAYNSIDELYQDNYRRWRMSNKTETYLEGASDALNYALNIFEEEFPKIKEERIWK